MVNLAHWALPWMTIMTRGMTVRAASKGSGGRRRPSREPAECASLDHTDTLKEQMSKLSNGLTKLTEKVTKMSERFSKLTEKVATLTKQVVSELYNENKRLRETVKKLDTRMSGLLSFNEQVKTEPGRCTIRRLDSFISVSNDMSRHRVLWEMYEPRSGSKELGQKMTSFESLLHYNDSMTITFVDSESNTKVEFKGDSEEILRKMGRLYPIGHLLEDIYKALEYCMYTLTCSQLIETIEQTPPKRYKPGKDWMKNFISENMGEAVSRAKRYGKVGDVRM
ncbi:hypothetical protein FOZ63_010776 [Perkinsus olseni]|uniref:Uncharacterized protein n=1 Tax=Perkinsus olseni TaxID=32597 RepID=A0A7J6QUM0_PEROL|nr:hypothetical protein FOZ63_010776 [Perkinsus olseni]